MEIIGRDLVAGIPERLKARRGEIDEALVGAFRSNRRACADDAREGGTRRSRVATQSRLRLACTPKRYFQLHDPSC
jgi:hypothetical protein